LLWAQEIGIEQSRWRKPYIKELDKGTILAWLSLGSSRCAEARYVSARKRADVHPLVFSGAGPIGNAKTYLALQVYREKALRISSQKRNIVYRIHTPISVSHQRLLDLLAEKGEDGHGVVDPTQFAFKTASEFVLHAEGKLGRDIRSTPVVDSEGGIRVTWRNGNRQVKLICPAAQSSPVYIYRSSPTGSSVRNQNVTFAALAEQLMWLLDGDQSEQPSK
jgi:hypothetical protein